MINKKDYKKELIKLQKFIEKMDKGFHKPYNDKYRDYYFNEGAKWAFQEFIWTLNLLNKGIKK